MDTQSRAMTMIDDFMIVSEGQALPRIVPRNPVSGEYFCQVIDSDGFTR
jgi:hypothetical protein